MSARVIDASVLARVLFPSQADDRVLGIVRGSTDRLFAPEVLRQETLNAALRLERRGRLSIEETERIAEVLAWPRITFLHDPAWAIRAFDTARKYGQPRIYDAIYLACADDLGVDLWTYDRRFVSSFGNERPANLRLCPDDIPAEPDEHESGA